MARTLALALSLSVLMACGGDDDAGTASTDSDTMSPDTMPTGTTPTTSSTGQCSTWVMTYDLTGSKFFIDALIDFTITLQEPYDADENMGPGTLTLRLQDVDGAAGEGAATLVDYQLTQDFITGNAVAQVHTELENAASDACGVSAGTLSEAVLTWTTEAMADHCQNGQISCEGAFCGTAGSPPEGEPEIITDDCGDQPITSFDFSPDLESFSMETVVVSTDDNATAAMQYTGTLLSAELDPNTPACLCP